MSARQCLHYAPSPACWRPPLRVSPPSCGRAPRGQPSPWAPNVGIAGMLCPVPAPVPGGQSGQPAQAGEQAGSKAGGTGPFANHSLAARCDFNFPGSCAKCARRERYRTPGSPRTLPAPGTSAVTPGRGHPTAPSPCPAPRGTKTHPKKPLLRVSCHPSPCHTALGQSRPPPPCQCRGHELSLLPLTSLAPCSVCVAGIHRVKAFFSRSPFNLDPLFISLLVFFSPPFLPKLLLSKS